MGRETTTAERFRTPLIWLSVVRLVVGTAALPLAPFLYKHHFIVLVLMRPGRLVLFVGGLLVKQHKTNMLVLIGAALPLALFGVWQAYALGLANAKHISSGRIPKPWKRLLPAPRIRELQRALRKQGIKLVLLGRLASFPNYLIGTAAGSSDMKPHRFLLADAGGVVLEIGISAGLGYAIGKSHGGRAVIIAIGVGLLVVAATIYGWQLHRE